MRTTTFGLAACAATLALAAVPATASADCDRLTRPIANRVSAAIRARAPAWARPLTTGAQLMRFDSAGLHAMTYFLGYSAITIERLGTGGAQPFSATVVVRCQGLRAEVVSDPYAWANARARELNVQLSNAEQASGYAAEVVSLRLGRRPDAANGRRTGGIFRVDVSLAPRSGDTNPQLLALEVQRNGAISVVQPTP